MKRPNYLVIHYFSVKIIDAETIQLVSEIPKKQVVEIGFSPKGTYISTWERPGSPDQSIDHFVYY